MVKQTNKKGRFNVAQMDPLYGEKWVWCTRRKITFDCRNRSARVLEGGSKGRSPSWGFEGGEAPSRGVQGGGAPLSEKYFFPKINMSPLRIPAHLVKQSLTRN